LVTKKFPLTLIAGKLASDIPTGLLDLSLVGSGRLPAEERDADFALNLDGRFSLRQGRMAQQTPLWVACRRFLESRQQPVWPATFSGQGRFSLRRQVVDVKTLKLTFPARRQLQLQGRAWLKKQRLRLEGQCRGKGFQFPFRLGGTLTEPEFAGK
jgi:hypothetical protein